MEKPKLGSHIHLMGICGTAMASLAGILKEMGYKVTGSDQNVYPPMSTQLQELGISIMPGYKKENLNPRPDLVIVGNVITKKHEEAQALLASDIPYTSLPKAMGEFVIEGLHSVVITGTHGKTTTSSMAAWVADQNGLNPGFMIGGIPENFPRSFQKPQGDYFVIEGDEYDTAFFDKVPKFIHYKPRTVILTGIEFDHADIYKNIDEIKQVFIKLMQLVPADGLVIANADDKNVNEVLKLARAKVITYGLKAPCDYQVVERLELNGRNHFSVLHKNEKIADIALKLPGSYNALNAIAVYALAKELGWNSTQSLQALASFKGVKRRQQVLGTPSGVTIVEDFAHHPTAVGLTIEALKERYLNNDHAKDNGRIFALFEPRSATSRRKIFQEAYVNAFKGADYTFISKPFDQSKIEESERFSSEELCDSLKSLGKEAQVFTSTNDMVDAVKSKAKKGDVIAVMSNGAFDGIYQKLLSQL
jgi:UDP-N-acetylmuramate: L-alanyl-gamma-D-glutamyl-meso-diaminopimelate ligase